MVRRLAQEIGVVGEADEVAQLANLSVAEAPPELEPERVGDRPRHDEEPGPAGRPGRRGPVAWLLRASAVIPAETGARSALYGTGGQSGYEAIDEEGVEERHR